MRRSRITQEQIVGVLKERQAGGSAADPCRSPAAVRRIIEAWRIDHNTARPHTGPGRRAAAAPAIRPRQGQPAPFVR